MCKWRQKNWQPNRKCIAIDLVKRETKKTRQIQEIYVVQQKRNKLKGIPNQLSVCAV